MAADDSGQAREQPSDCTARSRSESFVRLFVTNQRRIHGFIRTLIFEAADADDVLQETSITGLAKFDTFAEGRNDLSSDHIRNEFVTWICTIARYETLKFCREHKKGLVHFDEALFGQVAERQIERLDGLEARHAALTNCLSKLSIQDQSLLRGRYELSLTGDELAHSVGRSRNAVYKSLWKIRRLLTECVERSLKLERDLT